MAKKKTHREIIAPYEEKGLTTREIAGQTGLSYKAVYAAQHPELYRKKKKAEKLIERPKGWNKDRKACRRCRFRGDRNMVLNNCDYIVITGHSRGCPAEDCNKHIKGHRVRRDKGAQEEIDE